METSVETTSIAIMNPGNDPLEVERPRQLPLWELENPLKPQIPAAFFKAIPKTAGVYRLLDERGNLLYVGKAKNLRTRIRYYRSKTLMNGPKKLRELVRRVSRIEFELCTDEAAALLRENELLAKFKPPYNTVNTRPEAYPYIGFRETEHGIELKHAFERNHFADDFEIFGAFRATGQSLRAFGALLRQIHFWLTPDQLWSLPLMRPKTPRYFAFAIEDMGQRKEVLAMIRAALNGDVALVTTKPPSFLSGKFYETWWLLDLERLRELGRSCSYLKSLKEAFLIQSTYVAKEQLNDLSTLYSLRNKPKQYV